MTHETADHEVIPSYGARALRRWSTFSNGTSEHQTSRCRCLVRADGRALRGMAPLPIRIGSWAIAAFPSEVQR